MNEINSDITIAAGHVGKIRISASSYIGNTPPNTTLVIKQLCGLLCIEATNAVDAKWA